jgi:hypothetical protein
MGGREGGREGGKPGLKDYFAKSKNLVGLVFLIFFHVTPWLYFLIPQECYRDKVVCMCWLLYLYVSNFLGCYYNHIFLGCNFNDYWSNFKGLTILLIKSFAVRKCTKSAQLKIEWELWYICLIKENNIKCKGGQLLLLFWHNFYNVCLQPIVFPIKTVELRNWV